MDFIPRRCSFIQLPLPDRRTVTRIPPGCHPGGPMRHLIQERFVQKIKRSFLQGDALLLAAVLLLQGCKLDSTPDPFAFAGQSKVSPDSPIESEPVTISGINVPAQVSITG